MCLTDKVKNVLLVCGFGTGDADEMKETYGRLAEEAAEGNPGMIVSLALTSAKVIDRLYKKSRIRLPDVESALKEAAAIEAKEIRILTVQVVGGVEYEKLKKNADSYGEQISIHLDKPLLAGPKIEQLAELLVREAASNEEAVVYVGHGTHGRDPGGPEAYRKLEEIIRKRGNENIFIGELQTGPEPLLRALSEKDFHTIRLCSLMMVSGHHWFKDAAGEEADSWKNVLEKAGYKVTCVKTGLLERKEVRDLLIEPEGQTE